MRLRGSKYLAGVDIGSSKVQVLIGQMDAGGIPCPVGEGRVESSGLSRGVVVDIQSTVEAVAEAVEIAEHQAGCKVEGAVLSVGGDHVRAKPSKGMTRLRGERVDEGDLVSAMDAASAVQLGPQEEVLHALPQHFFVDGRGGVSHPVGLYGVRLDVDAFLVTADPNVCRNLETCLESCGLSVDEFSFSGLATAHAALTPEDREQGCCLLDIGADTTDIVVYRDGAAAQIGVVNMGGRDVTQDIRDYIHVSFPVAEDIKLAHGCALTDLVVQDDGISVPPISQVEGGPAKSSAPRQIARMTLTEVIEARYRAILLDVLEFLGGKEGEPPPLGQVVITGGAAPIEGLAHLAEELMAAPIRISAPPPEQSLDGVLDASANTALGLLHYAVARERQLYHFNNHAITAGGGKKSGNGPGVFGRLRDWWKDNV